MDVAKYIGLFLLKNNKCYVHGLGTFEIKRKPAKYDGESLHASSHEIILTTGGNVDESLANFIATNEQISISKATKSLKDFSDGVKVAVGKGEQVAIPSLGKIAQENGKTFFITAPQLSFTPPAIKAPKSAPSVSNHIPMAAPAPAMEPQAPIAQEPYSYEIPDDDGRKLNWGRIIITILILALLAAGTYFVWKKYLNKENSTTVTPPEMPQDMTVDSSMNTATDNVIDTTISTIDSNTAVTQPTVDSTNVAPVTNKATTVSMKVVLNTYDTRDRANKRYKQLTSYGNKVEIIKEDSNYFHVAMPVTAPATDTAQIMDSLRKYFNPDGVFIYQER